MSLCVPTAEDEGNAGPQNKIGGEAGEEEEKWNGAPFGLKTLKSKVSSGYKKLIPTEYNPQPGENRPRGQLGSTESAYSRSPIVLLKN